MTSLASVGLVRKTLALGLLSVAHHTSRLRSIEEGTGIEMRHAGGTSGQGLLEEKERVLEGERGNPRRGFPSGDEAKALMLLLSNNL